MTEPAAIPAETTLEQGFRLGVLAVVPADGSVTGPGGQEKLDPRVMDVLVMLARHAGHVVLREDLLARLWPGAVVTDDVLSRCIYELRRQVSQAGGDESLKALIDTVPKRGYRLNGEVAPLAASIASAPPAAGRRRFWLALAAIPVAAVVWFAGQSFFAEPLPASQSSIAILPFEDMSAGKDQGYLADGVAEEIISRLGRAGDLRVIARGSSFSFRGTPVDIRDIAAQLNVSHVLEGSVRKDGDNIRITAQLIAAADSSQLWSETFDRKLGDLFAVQDEIAIAVANALRVKLADAGARADRDIDHKAYDLYLQGQLIYNRRAPGDAARSVKYYQDSLAIEPAFARAWAALAGAYSLMAYEGDIAPDVGLEKQGEAARKAVELDPNLPTGQARLAQYYFDTGDRRTSYAVFDKALALDPNDPLVSAFAAGIAMRAGDLNEAIERYQRIVERDPMSAAWHANFGISLMAAGRLKEAETELRKAIDLNPGFGLDGDLAIARVLILQKRFEDADTAVKRLPDGDARDHAVALLAHARGDRAAADAALGRLAAQSMNSPDIRLAEVYAFRGMKDEAFEALAGLKEAIDRDEAALASQIWSWQVELRVSPFLTALHGDPRWSQLLHEPE